MFECSPWQVFLLCFFFICSAFAATYSHRRDTGFAAASAKDICQDLNVEAVLKQKKIPVFTCEDPQRLFLTTGMWRSVTCATKLIAYIFSS